MEYTVDQIREYVAKSDKWAIRALVALYARQTTDEMDSRETTHRNGRGFNKYDATPMSELAIKIVMGRDLLPHELNEIRSRLPKYARQLWSINKGEAIQ
jgi:hypothetical protein